MRTTPLRVGVLLASLLFWQLGTGVVPPTAQASDPGDACERTCPCEQESRAAGETNPGHGDADHSSPCPDGPCPSGCDDCACCPGGMVALATGPATVPQASNGRAEFLTPPDEAANAPTRRIFRPPKTSLV